MRIRCFFSVALVLMAGTARAETGMLATLTRQTLLSPTVPDNGDQNPYAVVVAPVGAGSIAKGDVLITNFNDGNNLQGLGATIVRYAPTTRALTLWAKLPRTLASCPGGVGLTAAMTMLRAGFVIVGSTPSSDGTPHTLGVGCLLVLNAEGVVVDSWTDPAINGPWGNMAVIDRGDSATLFVSNAGVGAGAARMGATVLRLELAIPAGGRPAIMRKTVVASGFGARGDRNVFLIGPTGLALGPDGTLYVSDAIGNRITAIADAATRGDSAGTGRVVTAGGLLQRPLAMVMAGNGHLLVTNGLNGQLVEIDPVSGKQLGARWIDADRAQDPPGSGDLFGLAMTPDGKGVYFVEDEINALMLAD